MAEKSSRGFVLGEDKEIVIENTAKKELYDLQFHKLGHRVTLITILIPILIAIIGYFIYSDIQKKVTKVYDTGSTEVLTLSKEMDSKFSSLSVQLSKLEEDFLEKTKTMEQTLASLKKSVDSVSEKVKATESNLNEQKKSVSGLSGKMSLFETSVKEIKSEIGNTGEKLSATVNEMAAEIGKTKGDIESLSSKLTTMASSKLDQGKFNTEINSLNDTMERNFFSMNKKLNALESKINQSARSSGGLRSPSSTSKEEKDQQADEVQMKRNKPQIPSDQDVDMLEQDIRE